MNIRQILNELEFNKGKFPKEALLGAIDRKNEIIPELLKILENTIKNIHELPKDHDYFAPIYALFLLAQFRELEVYPLVIQLFSKPITFLDHLFGDMITED